MIQASRQLLALVWSSWQSALIEGMEINPHDTKAASLDADGRHQGNVQMFCPHVGGWGYGKMEQEHFSG